MKTQIWIVAVMVTMVSISIGQHLPTWRVSTTGSSEPMLCIAFPADAQKGYIAGDEIALMTINTGTTWVNVPFQLSSHTDISCPLAPGNIVMGGSTFGSLRLIYTNDGANWTSVNCFEEARGYPKIRMSFPINTNTGYALNRDMEGSDNYKVIYRTTNTGEKWEWLLVNEFPMDLEFADNNTGLAVGKGGSVFVIRSAGQQRTYVYAGTTSTLQRVKMIDRSAPNLWYAVGDNGSAVKSTDGGFTWKVVSTGVTANLTDVAFSTDGKIGVAVGEQGVVLISSDLGDSWYATYYPQMTDLYSVSIPPGQSKVVYASGAAGLVIRTDDITAAGDVAVPASTSLHQNYPNPFNPSTTIGFTLSHRVHAEISVRDVLSREVDRIDLGVREPGEHSVSYDASKLPGGIYLYCLENAGERHMRTMVLVK